MSEIWQRCTKCGWAVWFSFFSSLKLYMKRTVITFCMTNITEAGSNCLSSELFSRFRIYVHSISVIVGDYWIHVSGGLHFRDVVQRHVSLLLRIMRSDRYNLKPSYYYCIRYKQVNFTHLRFVKHARLWMPGKTTWSRTLSLVPSSSCGGYCFGIGEMICSCGTVNVYTKHAHIITRLLLGSLDHGALDQCWILMIFGRLLICIRLIASGFH